MKNQTLNRETEKTNSNRETRKQGHFKGYKVGIYLLVWILTLGFITLVVGCNTASTSATTTSTTATTSSSTSTSSTTSTTSTTLSFDSALVAHYAFDEGTGATLGDSSSNSNDGTIYGATWTVEAHAGNALYFDGTNDSVQIPSSGEAAPSAINQLSEGSISIWFKYIGNAPLLYPLLYIGASPEVADTNEGVIIEVGHSEIEELTNSEDLFYTVTTAGADTPIFCYDSNVHITPEVWQHFVVTVSSTENTGYLNGQEISNRYYNFGDINDSYFLSTIVGNIMSIGYGRFAFRTAGQFYYYKGYIDDLRIYNQALSSSEVLELYGY